MTATVLTKTYPAPPIDRKEILRYAGCRQAEPAVEALLDEVLMQVEPLLTYKVCYRSVTRADLSPLIEGSERLAAALAGCERAILLGATVGIGLDRLIARYGRTAPAKALMAQAIGAERIEALCDAFCAELADARPRFSPGYGDLPLAAQTTLFALLDCARKIGLTLTESLLMSPSKSVTAIIGLESR